MKLSLRVGRARSVVVAALAAGASALALVACGSSSSSGSGGSSGSGSAQSKGSAFTVLYIVDETGPSKLYAAPQIWAAKQAAQFLNAKGGVLGHKVSITFANDNGDPGTAVSVLDKYLASHSKPNLVYPGSLSDEIDALLPLLARDHIFAVGNSEGIPGQLQNDAGTKFPEQFTINASASNQPEAIAAWFKSRGYKKVGLLEQDDSYIAGEAGLLVDALDKVGIEHVVATFPTSAVSLTPQVSQLKSAGVQAMYCGCLGVAVGYALTARSQLGWTVPVVGDLAASALDITKLVSPAKTKGMYETLFREDSEQFASLPATKYLLRRGFAAHAGPAEMSIAANGWDTLLIASNAAIQAKSLSGPAMGHAAENFTGTALKDPYYLQWGEYKYSNNTHTNLAAQPDNFVVVPAGPVVDGIVK